MFFFFFFPFENLFLFCLWIISNIHKKTYKKGRESSILNFKNHLILFHLYSYQLSPPSTLNYCEANFRHSSHFACKYFSMSSKLWFLLKNLILLPHLKNEVVYFLHQISNANSLFCLIYFIVYLFKPGSKYGPHIGIGQCHLNPL